MGTGSVDDLKEQFITRKPRYEALCEELKFSLTRKLGEAGIKWHSITTRPKGLQSFLEKVERKEYEDPFEDTEDLAGARIVCLFMVDLERVGAVISSMYEVLNKEDKITEGDASAFGYMSHHYVCKLSGRYAGERYDAIKGLKFEIQVRTILMDAWANMSHYLSYKNEESIPKSLVKDFHALSGLLYVGDRQFEALFNASSRSAATAEDRVLRSSEIQESEVNSDTIHALLARVFPDRHVGTAEAVSAFTSELHDMGYGNLAEVGEILEGNRKAGEARERRAFMAISKRKEGANESDYKYSGVGMGRAAFDAHDPAFLKHRAERHRSLMEKQKEGRRRA
ncbi:hypothetical protein ABZ519_40765 [Streptomyces collinus]|uniref:GTP pyrophosphokinase n=1 Tax=Streptomyces collinus TaxID=42684 RepID=UPI00340DC0D6